MTAARAVIGHLWRDVHPVEVVGQVVVFGEPVPKGRPRSRLARAGERRRDGTQAQIRTYTPKATKDAEELLAWQWRSQNGPPSPGPAHQGYGVWALFALGPAQGGRDADNLLKLALDALTAASAWVDDRQVTEHAVRMLVGDPQPRTELVVYRTHRTDHRPAGAHR